MMTATITGNNLSKSASAWENPSDDIFGPSEDSGLVKTGNYVRRNCWLIIPEWATVEHENPQATLFTGPECTGCNGH